MIVVKLVISICIVSATTIIGVLKAKKLKDREYILREMVTFLKLVENEIKYMMSILPNAYEISRQKLVTELKISIGQIVVDMLNSNGDFLIDQSIVTNISKIEGLTDYDKSVFISTLKNLGRSDLEGQINIIQNGITIIENQIKEASQIKISNSKLYKTMGIISGLMIVIIFI
jgi:stage III sporulation protein AB